MTGYDFSPGGRYYVRLLRGILGRVEGDDELTGTLVKVCSGADQPSALVLRDVVGAESPGEVVVPWHAVAYCKRLDVDGDETT